MAITHVLLLDLSLESTRPCQTIFFKELEPPYLLLGSEVVHNVEKLADFFGCLAFDHVGNSFATDITIADRQS
jgi:hypothetical protein